MLSDRLLLPGPVVLGPDSGESLAAKLDPGLAPGRIEVAPNVISVIQGLSLCEQLGRSIVLTRALWDDPEQERQRLGIVARIDRGDVEVFGNRGILDDVPLILIPTSGTTGSPKLASHTLSSLRGRIRKTQGQARWLLTYHPSSFAGVQVLLTVLATDGILVEPMSATLQATAQAGFEHHCTHISGTPTLWRGLISAWQDNPPPVRQITIGGEAVDQPLLDRLALTFPEARIVHIYASTEAGALFAVSDGREGFPLSWLDSAPDGIELRISEGVLQAKSPRRMVGYASDPSSQADWWATGDIVMIQGDRVLFAGREDSMINVGGSKVLPEEIERLALDVPGVKDVRVFGKANPILGQIVAAEVVCEPESDPADVKARLQAHLRALVPDYKVPRVVAIVDSLNFGATGKKDRTTL